MAAQITQFFEAANQMAIPHSTVMQLANEGISEPLDLAEFDKDALLHVATNLRRPGGRVPDPLDPNSTIPRPGFTFGAKS